MTIIRHLTGDEARAWVLSRAFRRVVKGQLVCQSLDSGEDDPDVEVYVGGALYWHAAITNDALQEFFDADSNILGAEEREILASLAT